MSSISAAALPVRLALTSQSVHRSMPRWEISRKHSLNLANAMVLTSMSSTRATETERFYQLLEQRSKASGKSVEQLKQEATAKDGLRRLGKPADISALVLFLCSEKARHIQGTAIAVDGGSTVGYY